MSGERSLVMLLDEGLRAAGWPSLEGLCDHAADELFNMATHSAEKAGAAPQQQQQQQQGGELVFGWGERQRILSELLHITRAAQSDAARGGGSEARVPPLTAMFRTIKQIADEHSIMPTFNWQQARPQQQQQAAERPSIFKTLDEMLGARTVDESGTKRSPHFVYDTMPRFMRIVTSSYGRQRITRVARRHFNRHAAKLAAAFGRLGEHVASVARSVPRNITLRGVPSDRLLNETAGATGGGAEAPRPPRGFLDAAAGFVADRWAFVGALLTRRGPVPSMTCVPGHVASGNGTCVAQMAEDSSRRFLERAYGRAPDSTAARRADRRHEVVDYGQHQTYFYTFFGLVDARFWQPHWTGYAPDDLHMFRLWHPVDWWSFTAWRIGWLQRRFVYSDQCNEQGFPYEPSFIDNCTLP